MMDFYIQNDVQPVMVVSYPVLQDDHTVSLLKSVFDKKQIVIGSHLHPWVTPPYKEELSRFNYYAGNLPYDLEKEKLRILTDHIQEKFNYRPIIYKAGRYGIGPNTNKILHELDYKYDLSYFAQRSFDYDFEIVREGTQPRWVRIHVEEMTHKSVSYRALWINDITAIVASEKQSALSLKAMEQAAEMKSNLLATMSHEIRTPMQSVFGFLELMLKINLVN